MTNEFTYDTPPDGWEDLFIWVNAFTRRGWKRFLPSECPLASQMPHLSLRQGIKATIPKYDEEERHRFHNKRCFFSQLNSAVNEREGRDPKEPPRGVLVGGKSLRVPFTFTNWEEFEKWRSETLQEELWFYKQEEKSRGSGVFPFVCRHGDPPPTLPPPSSSSSSSSSLPPPPGVFQQAVPRFLRTSEGKKFDLRVLAWFGPGRKAFMCRKVFGRVAGESMGENSGGLGADLSFERHLTNLSVGGRCVLVEDLAKIVREKDQHVVVVSSLLPSISLAVGDLLRLLPPSWFPSGKGFYFGFDFMVDEEGLIWLLEANSRPRLRNCNKLEGGVEEALVELLKEVIEPSLEGKEGREMELWEQVL